MKEINIQISAKIVEISELNSLDRTLIQAAIASASKAYAPYSGFQVGAAIRLNDGKIVTGNNQENAAYPSGICAERVAIFHAGAQYPDIPVETIAIAAYSSGEQTEHISPCGSCRQVMLETADRYDKIIRVLLCGKNKVTVVDDVRMLLPLGFDKAELYNKTK